ncbi:hypothetical protein M378DRAFT_171494 [Amanita muscaria Koide BX008]|uniref:Uncharacterized protein n=1 Tax=Amanita muscaria (strain Koide BX008) TaxID=946122 RepID=A0A0C2S4N9_AMAMK|nr:hypothetical protein M378DRAFT_171494 [Amanita muscaria Koide BX008]
MDQARCMDPRLQIDPRICHTQIATRCFDIMDKHLKYNILGLGDPARFMSNEDGLKEDGITDEQLEEKIPQQLRYASVYWVNHLEAANTEDADLVNGLENFLAKHILHWFEVLSLIGKFNLAQLAIFVVLKLLVQFAFTRRIGWKTNEVIQKSSSDSHHLLSDALRFISKFYKIVKQSALHTYYSALSLTPTDSLLYRRYNKETEHNIFAIEDGPEKWDALVANLSHGGVTDIKFSLDSTLFVSCSNRVSKIWDAATGKAISTIPGHIFAVANDFSTVASSKAKTITFYNVNGRAAGTMFTTPSDIQALALSSEGVRVAAGLSDGTVWLWDSGNGELIDSLDGFECEWWSQLQFSSTGTRLAYSLAGGIKLRDGISGRFIADLGCGSSHNFKFSGDGSRIASLSFYASLALWNSEDGVLIANFSIGDRCLAISANGSLIATADQDEVKVWGDSPQINVLELKGTASMTFSLDNILVLATFYGVTLWNVETDSIIHMSLRGRHPTALALSPDYTRLAVGDRDGNVNLCDIRGIDASGPLSTGNAPAVTALSLSRDCSRLACGYEDGTVELWGTSPTKRIASHHKAHDGSVQALGFGPDGGQFASGSYDGIIELWNGEDGLLCGTLEGPSGSGSVALSKSVLVAAGERDVTLWSLDTRSLIHTFTESRYEACTVSIAENDALIAVAHRDVVSLLDAENHRTITTINVPHNYKIHTMTFIPDKLLLVAQSRDGVFLSFNLINKHLPDISIWRGVPIWHCMDKTRQHYFLASFSQHKSPVPVLWIPRHIHVKAWTQGSSMIALGCEDGRVILLRLPNSRVS